MRQTIKQYGVIRCHHLTTTKRNHIFSFLLSVCARQSGASWLLQCSLILTPLKSVFAIYSPGQTDKTFLQGVGQFDRFAYKVYILIDASMTSGGKGVGRVACPHSAVLYDHFSALRWQVNVNQTICETPLPSSTKGWGAGQCILCIDGFMESFDLFSYCILSGVEIDFLKELMILFFLPLPPPPTSMFSIWSWIIYGSFTWNSIGIFFYFFFALNSFSSCVFSYD